MGEHGGVGIVFHASRSGRCLLVSLSLPLVLAIASTRLSQYHFLSLVQVKSLVPGGAAEKSCAVEVGHQIIAIGDNDVSSSTLEEVSISHLYILAHLLVSRYIGLSLDIINGLSDIFGRDNCSWFFWQHAGLCN